MGAPVRAWTLRAAIVVVLAVGCSVLFIAPLSVAVRAAILASGLAAAGALAFRFLPAFDPAARIHWRLQSAGRGKRCALTFDDGPSPSTVQVLDILSAERIPATFFVLGDHVDRHPEAVRRMQAEGHVVGIHGMNHAKLAGASEDEVERQVAAVTGALRRIGVRPAPVYRTPHGAKSRGVFSVARRRSLTLWAWSRGIWDTDRPSPDVLVRRATRFARSGMVLLLHDGRGDERHPDVGPMVAALPRIIGELRRRGFDFVRLADA